MNTISDRFWAKVPNKPDSGCWPWGASTKGNGYGQIYIRGKRAFAHRVAYELAIGEIPNGKLVRHKCDNPLCVRPDHLELGTQKENMDDMISRGRARYAPYRGERNPSSKISDRDTIEIRSDRTSSLKQLALRYGVSSQRISQIQNRKMNRSLDARGAPVECTEQ